MTDLERLIALALGELPDDEAAALDEHVLACTACAEVLERLLLLGDGVRALVGTGAVRFVVGDATLAQLERAGLIAKVYRLSPNDGVACSVGAADVYQLCELTADLAGVTQLDLVVRVLGRVVRIADVPFDGARNVVRVVELGNFLRQLPTTQEIVELISVEDGGDRPVGTYYFNHTAG